MNAPKQYTHLNMQASLLCPTLQSTTNPLPTKKKIRKEIQGS